MMFQALEAEEVERAAAAREEEMEDFDVHDVTSAAAGQDDDIFRFRVPMTGSRTEFVAAGVVACKEGGAMLVMPMGAEEAFPELEHALPITVTGVDIGDRQTEKYAVVDAVLLDVPEAFFVRAEALGDPAAVKWFRLGDLREASGAVPCGAELIQVATNWVRIGGNLPQEVTDGFQTAGGLDVQPVPVQRGRGSRQQRQGPHGRTTAAGVAAELAQYRVEQSAQTKSIQDALDAILRRLEGPAPRTAKAVGVVVAGAAGAELALGEARDAGMSPQQLQRL